MSARMQTMSAVELKRELTLCHHKNKLAEARITTLEEALRFYAHEASWKTGTSSARGLGTFKTPAQAHTDNGKRARAALSQQQEEQ